MNSKITKMTATTINKTKSPKTDIFWKKVADKWIIKNVDEDLIEDGEIPLPANANSKEIKQYFLQKLIQTHLRINCYPTWEQAWKRTQKKLGISSSRLEDICRGKISDFSLNEITRYVKKLIPEKEMWIETKEILRTRA